MTTQCLLLMSHWYDRLLFNSPNRPGSKQRGCVIFCAACKSPTDWLRVSASCQGQSARAAAGRHVREVPCAALAVTWYDCFRCFVVCLWNMGGGGGGRYGWHLSRTLLWTENYFYNNNQEMKWYENLNIAVWVGCTGYTHFLHRNTTTIIIVTGQLNAPILVL